MCRPRWNHPHPDGNKRAAWAAPAMFIDLNQGTWERDPPDIDPGFDAQNPDHMLEPPTF